MHAGLWNADPCSTLGTGVYSNQFFLMTAEWKKGKRQTREESSRVGNAVDGLFVCLLVLVT